MRGAFDETPNKIHTNDAQKFLIGRKQVTC